ncbi:phosphatase PAP2 family protein [Variovorax sp. RHLX14]|uniref:phosphatase PAP2 family protein n=1 Tax=Variovorax sp. RHLX14 TaxID=1259731 RepID=UPI003F45E036
MHALNLRLFQWMAAGFQPHPALLGPASLIASGGPWICIAIMGWIAWRQPRHRGFVMAALVVAGITSLLSHGLSTALHVSRPFVVGLGPAYVAHSNSGSMPSTHASVMFAVALLFLLRPGLRRYGIAMFALAAFTGWARIYVGVHFPADIGAGLLLACAVAGVFILLRRLLARLGTSGGVS